MSEKDLQRQNYPSDQKRVFNTDFSEMPALLSGSSLTPKSKFNGKELDAMCKNPRQSAELIRYLIEFIKSL